jgi:RNA polymerase sigma-70 factor, ECF subfamily
MSNTDEAIEAMWKIESTRLIAAIARVTRDIGIAEELARMRLLPLSNAGRTKVSRKSLPRG